MLQKRRLTVQPVDAAFFCGHDNSMVVSFSNGVDHLVHDPAATDQNDAQPLSSRVVAHTYTGAQLADAALDTQREYVAEAAVSSAAIIACRVTPLTTSKADPTSTYKVRADGPSKVVFFSGCQRMAEVRLSAEVAMLAASDTRVDPAACPMQCFRVESSGTPGSMTLDIAAFIQDAQTLCTCTPQLGNLQRMRFDNQQVCCMGPGRVGRAEVTVVLSSGVAVLCGMLNRPPQAADQNDDGFDSEDQQQQQLTSSSTAASRTAAARRAFAAATERSRLRIIHTIHLPQIASPTTSTNKATPSPTPRRVAWSGASTLWVIYADGSVVAVQCAEARPTQDTKSPNHNKDNEESQQADLGQSSEELPTEATMTAEQVLHTQLAGTTEQNILIQDIQVNADPRAPIFHVAFTCSAGSEGGRHSLLYYGTVRVGAAADAADNSNGYCSTTILPSPPVQWRLQWMLYNEQLYGVRFERGQYHILTQGARGKGPLYVAALPRFSSVRTSQTGASPAATERVVFAEAIMVCPESELAQHCRACESLLRELHTAAQQMSHEDDAEALLHQLMQAQHALYALLRRQHQSMSVTDLTPNESWPYRLLQRAARLYRQLSAYVLLLRLGVIDTVTRPVHEVLRLEEAAAISKVAQMQWNVLMRDTFRSGSVYQSAVSELAMWESPTQLCVDVLLSQLGLSAADASCTMATVLSKMDTFTTEYALFVLYYSYQVMGCAGDANTAMLSHDMQHQQRQWRESFLLLFGQSIELNVWSFVCYAVDHGINPAEQREEAADVPMLPILGNAVHHLGAPPFHKLLAPVLNGLAHVAALDVLMHMVPSCLAAYTAATESVPLSVSMRLLCVAVRIGSHRMIEALYEATRGSALLRDLAAQPLAFAALAARDVSVLRGWVEIGSPVAATIERTLLAAENVSQRELVLIAFYILLQRYEDALRVCSSATAADATQAQRLQVVLSYLRSLLSASSEILGEEGASAVAPFGVEPLLPLDSTVLHPWSQSALAAPLLETSMSTLAEELKCATGAAAAGGERGCSKNFARYVCATSGVAASATTVNIASHPQQLQHSSGDDADGSAGPKPCPPLFRPSTLLMSLERGAGSRSASFPSPDSIENRT